MAHEAKEAVRLFPRDWKQQLEMFAHKPQALVFLQPDGTDVLSMLRRLQVRHIVDLRDVPYLTFDRCNRSNFFETLAATKVNYLGMHELMHQEGMDSPMRLLQESMECDFHGAVKLQELLSAKIGHGPTAVFCDDDPKQDSKVSVLLDFLAKRQIKHEPVMGVAAD